MSNDELMKLVDDQEWEDGDDAELEDTARSEGFTEGHDEGFALALGMVFDYVQSVSDIDKTNAVEIMNIIANRRAE